LSRALDDAVEGAGAEFHFAVGAECDFFKDGVAVEVVAGECEEDVEHGRS